MILSVSIEIGRTVFRTNINVIVTVIYRPPNTDTRIFNERLNAVLNCVNNESNFCYLMGDII